MDRKIAVLKKMVALARSVPDEWAQHEKIGDTPQGWALHAMVLDIDVGPMLQTHKLLTSVIFAREKGYTRPLTAAELEMMNLTGDGTGLDMVTMPQAMREQVPTSNFFQRARLRAQPGGDPPQHGGEAAGGHRRADGLQQQSAGRQGTGGGVLAFLPVCPCRERVARRSDGGRWSLTAADDRRRIRPRISSAYRATLLPHGENGMTRTPLTPTRT